jgi:hypothetical protein
VSCARAGRAGRAHLLSHPRHTLDECATLF